MTHRSFLLLGCSHCLLHFHRLLNRLQINLDGDHRTRHEPHRCALAQAKIVAIDRRPNTETCMYAHHRTLTTVMDIEGDGSGHPVQGQIPGHLVVLAASMLDVCARKGNSGILLHAKEGSGPQVGTTQLIPCIDAGRLHLGIDPGVGRMLLSQKPPLDPLAL